MKKIVVVGYSAPAQLVEKYGMENAKQIFENIGNQFIGNTAMKKIEDYTKDEIFKFEAMREVLAQYNKDVQAGKEELTPPPYSDEEMMAFSRYCELLLARELRDFRSI